MKNQFITSFKVFLGKTIGTSFIVSLLFITSLSATEYEVTAFGNNASDAEGEAKILLLEAGIGALVEGGSAVMNDELQYKFISSYTKGYINNFKILSKEKSGKGWMVKAKGNVDLVALGNAIEERKKEIGNPKMMILMSETLFGKQNKSGDTKSEYIFQAEMKKLGFEFVDEEMMKKVLAREKGLQVGAYGNPKLEELALKVAAELNTDVLVIADTKLKNAGKISGGSGIFTYQSDIKYKLVNVGTAGILATNNEVERHAAEDDELGATELLKKTNEKIVSDIKEQISKDWQAGSTTRILFRGIELGDYMRSNLNDVIGKIRGVNSVDDRGTTEAGLAIEVKCFCSSGRLIKDILRRSFELDYTLNPKDLKGNSVYMDVNK